MTQATKRQEPRNENDRYARALRAKAEELRRNLSARNATAVLSRREDSSDEGDLSHQSHEEWIFINRNSLDARLAREVQDALRRIQDGTYGVCLECGEPISLKRLQAVPWAKFCVRCQEILSVMNDHSRVVDAA